MKELILCRPCAEELKAENKVEIGASMRDKQTCDCCKKRRFVYKCTKLARIRMPKKEDK